MRTKKNRLFKTLVTVMLLFIMTFTVTGCNPDIEKKAFIKHTKTTVTLTFNYNCYVEITIKVLDGQKEDTLTKSININKNDVGVETLRIEDFVSDYYYSDEAIITEIVSIDFIEKPASEVE